MRALRCERMANVAKTKALKPSELSAVVVDTTVQPKNVAHPTDAKLLNRARERLARLAKKHAFTCASLMRGWENSRSSSSSATPRQNSSGGRTSA
jgi:hypothetical protein